MIHRIEIAVKESLGDPHAAGVLGQIRELGIDAVQAIKHRRLFFLAGELTAEDARRIADDLLIDPVVEEFVLADDANRQSSIDNRQSVIEVHL